MGLGHFARTALKNPSAGMVLVRERLAPQGLLKQYSSLCTKSGMNRPGFILSFDCDTKKDFEVVGDVHARLNDLEIMPVYAVPGALLQLGEKEYRKILDSGAEFINHGFAEHTIFDENKGAYVCTLYYHLIGRDAVRVDVEQGHRVLSEFLEKDPAGFRTPHFGSYQDPAELSFLHSVLKELGYRYSTSSGPLEGLQKGPVTHHYGLAEIPVTGCYHWPATILDSFTFRFSASEKFTQQSYIEEIWALSDMMKQTNLPFLVNIYADPSQVYDWPEFFEAMSKLAQFNIPNYGQFLDGLFL